MAKYITVPSKFPILKDFYNVEYVMRVNTILKGWFVWTWVKEMPSHPDINFICDDVIVLKWPDYMLCAGEKCNICHWLHLIQLVILNFTFKGITWREVALNRRGICKDPATPPSTPNFSSFQMCRWQQLSVGELEKLQQLEKHFNLRYVKWCIVYGIIGTK